MALLGNGSIYCKMPLRHFAGSTTSVQTTVRGNFNSSGAQRNVMYRDCDTTTRKLWSLPTGAYPHLTWSIAQVAGSLSSRKLLSGEIALAANLAGAKRMTAALTSTGGYAAINITGAAYTGASLTGSGTITPTGSVLAIIAAALSGTCTITSSVGSAAGLSADLTGAGVSAATLSGALGVSAALTAGGSLAVDGSLLSFIEAALTGLSDVTGVPKGGWLMVGALNGAGDFTPDTHGHGIFGATTITGVGSASATPYASGGASATLRAYGDLTPEGLSAAVWQRVIEAGFSAEEVLRILAAVAAGNATDLEGASPSFKGLDGTTTRVAGSYGAGERVIGTVNGD